MDSRSIEKYLDALAREKPDQRLSLGCVPSNGLSDFSLKKFEDTPLHFAFAVMNTEPKSSAGKHWVSLLIDFKHRTIEYFDPYGLPPERGNRVFLEKLEKENDKLPQKKAFQFKINMVQQQRFTIKLPDGHLGLDNLCGIYSMIFIRRRVDGDNFIKATGYRITPNNLFEFTRKLNKEFPKPIKYEISS